MIAESQKSGGLEKHDSRLIKIRVAWKTFVITSCYKNILFNANKSLIQMLNALRLDIVYDNANSKTRQFYSIILLVQGSLKTFRENCFLLQLWQAKDMRKYSDVCQMAWNFLCRNTMISRWNFHMYMGITFGNYEIDYSLFWTIQFLIGVRMVKNISLSHIYLG